MIQVTYQKKDGTIFKRLRKTYLPYNIGQQTPMGWKVLNIEYEYKNNYYTQLNFYKEIEKSKQLWLKKKKIKELFTNEIKLFLYSFLAVAIINLIKLVIGV